MEQWKDIPDYEGVYQVSNLGRIKALPMKKLRGRFYHNLPERILKPSTYGKYLKITLQHNDVKRHFTIHKLVALCFVLNPENKPQINHINGVKRDNRAINLEWCTNKENIQHSNETGLVDIKGEKSKSSKLKNEDILFIRNSNLPQVELARKFHVYHNHIHKIIKREVWKHI